MKSLLDVMNIKLLVAILMMTDEHRDLRDPLINVMILETDVLILEKDVLIPEADVMILETGAVLGPLMKEEGALDRKVVIM